MKPFNLGAGFQPPALPRFAPPQQRPMMPQVPPAQAQPGRFNPGFMQLLQSLGRNQQTPGAMPARTGPFAPGGQQPPQPPQGFGANQQQIMAALNALAGIGG